MRNNIIYYSIGIIVMIILIMYLFVKNDSSSNSTYTVMKNQDLKIKSINVIYDFYNWISNSEKKVYSQDGEDGVFEMLIDFIKIKRTNGYYVEIGTQNCQECNSRYLRERYQWTGLLLDGFNEDPMINLHKETILFSNVLSLFEKYKVPIEFDILSEDTNYADYYIVEAILTKYRPKIVVHEVNQQPGNLCVTVQKEDKLIFWDYKLRSNYHGGSVCAFWCLAQKFDYTMVYCEKAGVNCFWIRNDLLEENLNGIDHRLVQTILNPTFLYKKPKFTYKKSNNEWAQIEC